VSEYTPTTEEMRAFTIRHWAMTEEFVGSAFDRWLAAHDHEVRTQWEMRRKADPIIIENIQGEPAMEWMRKDREQVWDEGWNHGLSDAQRSDGVVTTNPYRSES
jgi:hypothetical protein